MLPKPIFTFFVRLPSPLHSHHSCSTMVAGKIVVSGVPRLPPKTRYPANNNFAKYHSTRMPPALSPSIPYPYQSRAFSLSVQQKPKKLPLLTSYYLSSHKTRDAIMGRCGRSLPSTVGSLYYTTGQVGSMGSSKSPLPSLRGRIIYRPQHHLVMVGSGKYSLLEWTR